jgi:hypothetical protein
MRPQLVSGIRQITRERLANAKPEDYIPLEDMAAELGWHLGGNSAEHHPNRE